MERSHKTSMSTFPPFEMSAPNSVRSSNSYTEIQIQCREGAIYMYIWFLFEEKGAGKQCCRRTCGHSIHRIRSDLQASHRKRFSFSSTSGIFCYVDTIASRSKHDFIFPSSSFKRNQSHLSFSFFEEKCFVCFFLFFVYHPLEKFEVNTHTIHFVSRCQSCDNRY